MRVEPPILKGLEADDLRWEAFVDAHPDGTFFHRLGWRRVIRQSFPGHEAHYLYVEQGGRVVGVLPLFAAGRFPFARALVSVPVGVYGGILAETEDVARMLANGARALAERLRLPHVEYKSKKPVLSELPTVDDRYSIFRQELFPDPETQLKAIPRKSRAMIREAEAAQLAGSYNRDDLAPFLDLYALSLRNLGTPMFPKALFTACLDVFPETHFVSVRKDGRVLAVAMNFVYKNELIPFFAGSVPEARDIGINNYLYWFMLSTGYGQGYRSFDFGRSKTDTGAYRFKKHFGMKPEPLAYQYALVATDKVPELSPTNPRYQQAIALWKKLPVDVTRRLGPLINRRLG
jgi:FemAB-related protein (PEP-CTERM system-associated)